MSLPRIAVIDDTAGRLVAGRRNTDRHTLCVNFGLKDITDDQQGLEAAGIVNDPLAEAVFFRGQLPVRAKAGDTVENDLEGAISFIREGWDRPWTEAYPRWAMVLLDLCFCTGKVTTESQEDRGTGMPAGRDADREPRQYFGWRLLEALKREFPDLPVVIFSSMDKTQQVELDFSEGKADKFLHRDYDNAREELGKVLAEWALLPDPNGILLGHSVALLKALRSARRLAAGKSPVLIRGESGTGKELLARTLHHSGPRRNRNLVAINCGALTETLLESELFGYVKGIFTGANEDKIGLIELADRGTLFLDEIGDMSLKLQVKLLRVLEDGKVRPIGALEERPVDVRYVAATNKDLVHEIEIGAFREDLFRRLGLPIFLPPLRERQDDIPFLMSHFLEEIASELRIPKPAATPRALEVLTQQTWPGNVRQLRGCAHRAVLENKGHPFLPPADFTLDKVRASPSSKTLDSPRTGQATIHDPIVAEGDAFALAGRLGSQVILKYPSDAQYCDRGRFEEVTAAAAALLLGYLHHAAMRSSGGRDEVSIVQTWEFLTGQEAMPGDVNRARSEVAPLFLLCPEQTRKALRRSKFLCRIAIDVAERSKTLRGQLDDEASRDPVLKGTLEELGWVVGGP